MRRNDVEKDVKLNLMAEKSQLFPFPSNRIVSKRTDKRCVCRLFLMIMCIVRWTSLFSRSLTATVFSARISSSICSFLYLLAVYAWTNRSFVRSLAQPEAHIDHSNPHTNHAFLCAYVFIRMTFSHRMPNSRHTNRR